MRTYRHTRVATLLIPLLSIGIAACQKGSKDTKDKPAAGSNQGSAQTAGVGSGSAAAPGTPATPPKPVAPAEDIDSKDILARTDPAKEVHAKHILLGWKELAPVYQGHQDPRAAKRTNAEAAALAKELYAKLKANPDSIDVLVKENSEDPGAQSGDDYTIKADTPFVPEFKNLALRLKEKEVGLVKTNFGYHVIERVPPPPPDPLESADILARPAEEGPVHVLHILIGWKDTPAARSGRADKKAMERTKADADKVAKEVVDKLRAKGDMVKLMKEYSEDPGSKDTGKDYEVGKDTPMVEPFKNMALRLKLDEIGVVKSPFGWHIMKRVPPPPPDPLETADILKRPQATEKAKVKHILLGWAAVHAEDERGKKRDRPALEKLVKDTVAKLKKGAKIEPLMAELSEDPGSAKSGNSYDVTPTAGLVAPFKNLALRLKVNEVGVVKSDFGIHIIQRVE
ncbi:MAG TPA: peptidylprolyl isomerase [Kofleriaceae bacterium]|nr:peptidylprolyl isomerase [Kofleriaceae bacterium]